MKPLIFIFAALLLSGCTAVEYDTLEKYRAGQALREAMRECPTGSVRYQSSSGNEGGVSWYTMRCTAKKVQP